MLIETLNPTPAHVLEEGRVNVPDSARIMGEIVRRMKATFPALITYKNAQHGWDGKHTGILQVKPENIRLAPAFFDDSCKNSVLVMWGTRTLEESPKILKSSARLTLFFTEPKYETDEQIQQGWRRAELAQMFWDDFLTGCVDPNGVQCWRTLVHDSTDNMPPEIANGHSGVMQIYTVSLTPRANGR